MEVVLLFEDPLLKHLHGIVAALLCLWVCFLDQEHLGEGTLSQKTNDSYRLEIDHLTEGFDCLQPTCVNNLIIEGDTFFKVGILGLFLHLLL